MTDLPPPADIRKPDWMLATAGISIGLLLAIWLGYLLGVDAKSSKVETFPTYKSAIESKAPVKSTPSVTRRPCVDMASEGESDLCAQWSAASAATQAAAEARRATNWSLLGIAVGCLTVIGLFVTIRQTAGSIAEAREGNLIAASANEEARRRALEDAADTAKAIAAAERNAAAADAQVEVATSTAKRQLRAYLHMRGVYLSDFENYDLNIVFKAKNYGLTPANDIQLYVAFDVKYIDDHGPLSDPVRHDSFSTAPVGKNHFYVGNYKP